MDKIAKVLETVSKDAKEEIDNAVAKMGEYDLKQFVELAKAEINDTDEYKYKLTAVKAEMKKRGIGESIEEAVDLGKIKKAIEEYEYYTNGFHKLSGHSVKAEGVKKVGEDYVADVTLIDDEDGKEEKYKSAKYSLAILSPYMKESKMEESKKINEAGLDIKLDPVQAFVTGSLVKWAIEQPQVKEDSAKEGAMFNWVNLGANVYPAMLASAKDGKGFTVSGPDVATVVALLDWAIKQPEVIRQSEAPALINLVGVGQSVLQSGRTPKPTKAPEPLPTETEGGIPYHEPHNDMGEAKKKIKEAMKYDEKYYTYLDDLRDSGETNMFGARPYLQREFGLEAKEAGKILSNWMETFSERHPKESRLDNRKNKIQEFRTRLKHAKIKERVEDSASASFGPGKYYLGDICYVMKEDVYDKVWGDKHNFESGVHDAEGVKFAVAGTAYGDGTYKGSDGKEYGVDAGVIGIVPEALWDVEKAKRADELGKVLDVKKLLNFSAHDGVFNISADGELITINTKEEESEEQEENEGKVPNIGKDTESEMQKKLQEKSKNEGKVPEVGKDTEEDIMKKLMEKHGLGEDVTINVDLGDKEVQVTSVEGGTQVTSIEKEGEPLEDPKITVDKTGEGEQASEEAPAETAEATPEKASGEDLGKPIAMEGKIPEVGKDTEAEMQKKLQEETEANLKNFNR